MTREEAVEEIKSWAIPSKKGREVLETLIPELRESEDERIRKWLIKELEAKYVVDNIVNSVEADKALAWLEKQKEQKSVEDVAKEAVKDKDSAIKFLKSAGIMDENGELAEMYRSEQKPAEWSKEDDEEIQKIIVVIESVDEENHRLYPHARILHNEYKEMIAFLKSLPLNLKKKNEDVVKPCSNEWSKEDEKILSSIINDFRSGNVSTIGQEQWLKDLPNRFSLRPQQKRNCKECAMFLCGECTHPHWKPGEEQMEALTKS